MLHLSKAIVGPGEVVAHFPLRMRNSAGNYRATVACMYAAAEEV